jgi:hypothetical protein
MRQACIANMKEYAGMMDAKKEISDTCTEEQEEKKEMIIWCLLLLSRHKDNKCPENDVFTVQS